MEQYPTGGQTVVATPPGQRVLVWLGFGLALAGAGGLLQALAGWIASLPWAPFQGGFARVDQLPDPAAGIGAAVLGAGAGLVLAHLADRERLTVRVAGPDATLTRNGRSRTVARGAVGAVFLDRTELVLLDRTGRELAREPSDQDTGRLAAAFREHGYPWHDGDPHRHAYRRWVPGTPGLPPGADALLAARQRALEQRCPAALPQLRAELGQLGVVVRDDQCRQYVRRTGDRPAVDR